MRTCCSVIQLGRSCSRPKQGTCHAHRTENGSHSKQRRYLVDGQGYRRSAPFDGRRWPSVRPQKVTAKMSLGAMRPNPDEQVCGLFALQKVKKIAVDPRELW